MSRLHPPAIARVVLFVTILVVTHCGLAHAQAGPMFRAPGYQLGTPNTITWLSVADLNGDGIADLVCGLDYDSSLGIALAKGGGSFGPFRTYFPERGGYRPEVADFDGDGKLDVGGCTSQDDVENPPAELLVGFGDGNGGIVDSSEVTLPSPASVGRAGDLDHDGRADLVVCMEDSTLLVYHSGPGRTFTLIGTYATPDLPVGLTLGDVNGDGTLDVVVGYGLGTPEVSVFPGDGSGGLGTRVDVATGASGSFLELAQMDAQPGLDLLLAAGTDEYVTSGNGAGGFAPAALLPQAVGGYGLAVADLDHDGKLDVVSGNAYLNSRSILAWRGDGIGGFGPRIDSHVSVIGPLSMRLGDLDGDGNLDAAYPGNLIAALVYAKGNGDGTFGSAYPAPMAGVLRGVATGDFDGDGKLDAVGSDNYEYRLVFAHGNGDGTLAALSVSAATPHGYNYLVAGEFDSDSNLDLVGITLGPPSLSYLKGHGDGTFAAPVDFALGASPKAPTLVDLNRDGWMDVVVPCAGANALDVYLGGPTSPTGPSVSPTPAGPVAVRFADLDGDGRLDRVLACATQLVAQLDDGAGGWTTVQTVSLSSSPGDLALADVDGDGVPDAITSDLAPIGSSTAPPQFVRVMKGHTDGTFDAPTAVSFDPWLARASGYPSPGILSLHALDIDGDGRADLLARANSGVSAWAARGHGDGTFDFPEIYSTGFGPGGIAFGDLDGDGRIDVVTAGLLSTSPGPGSSSLVPLRNQTGGIVAVGPGPGGPGAHSELALSRVAPNPSAGRFAFTLTAAHAGAARLALYSPTGREVYARERVALVAGANRVTLDVASGALPAGVYWLRASVGAARATGKVVVLGR